LLKIVSYTLAIRWRCSD